LSLAHQRPPSPAVVIAAAATGGSGRARKIVAVPPPPSPSLQPPLSSTATIIVATKPFLLPPPPPPPNLVLFGRSTFSHTEESGHQEVKSKRVLNLFTAQLLGTGFYSKISSKSRFRLPLTKTKKELLETPTN
jgi:hypothetical protein